MNTIRIYRLRVYGIVQGVGFRPFVSRTADKIGLTGRVANKGSYVEIEAQGTDGQWREFCRELQQNPPKRAVIMGMDSEVREAQTDLFSTFSIEESEEESGYVFVPPDIGICSQCRKELLDPSDRRYLHPFINCTACGPRLTILDAMPYDRERTSMGEFLMCPACEYEYTHAATRRYDAQPVCCHDCGPIVYMADGSVKGKEALTVARKAILDGEIIAVKGIGGFHLCCDATNEAAVRKLRERKHRPAKPLAVMMRDMSAAERECEVAEWHKEWLEGYQKPIVLLPKRNGGRLAPSVAPGNPKVGVLLPYAPVHILLFEQDDGITMTTDCLVMTSGNVSGAPICRTEEDAKRELAGFCDRILSHNRKILLRADDSVMDFYKEKPYMIRRSRGFAPLPIRLKREFRGQVLAMGGELKNTFCLVKDQFFYLSPYVGDMTDLRTVQTLQESIRRMEQLLEITPAVVVCDKHPNYHTTALAKDRGLPLIQVQHHHAHVLSCMAENDYDRPVIGVAFDGTGYGEDGTIWGGEILCVSYEKFERLGSIVPFWQIGGDASAREGWRIAVAMINALYEEEAAAIVKELDLCSEETRRAYERMAKKKIRCVRSTSAGRLFDAASAILGVKKTSVFEGEASMALEFAAEEYKDNHTAEQLRADRMEWSKMVAALPEEFPKEQQKERQQEAESSVFYLPTDRLIRQLIALRRQEGPQTKEQTKRAAYVFHVSLAHQIAEGCRKASEKTGLSTCALSGGVFQNQLLLSLCEEELEQFGFHVLRHSMIPPNDGGIALGQAVAAMVYAEKQITGE